MPKEQIDERTNAECHEREFGERLVAWWNQGAEKAALRRAKLVVPETTKREAA